MIHPEERRARPAASSEDLEKALETWGHLLAYVQRYPEAENEILQHFERTADDWDRIQLEGRRALRVIVRDQNTAVLERFGVRMRETQESIALATLDEALGRNVASDTGNPDDEASAIGVSVPLPPPSSSSPSSSIPSAPPLMAAPPQGEPRLKLTEYASLRAEVVACTPEQLAEVRGRYGLDEASDLAEAAAWSRRFTREPGLFEQYKSMFQYLRSLTSLRAREAS